ncbi:hypothetical protein [Paenibacillus thalictri]|uniref:Uncharacterized protein n=1 Tax=Paenibacillus thalictri TaxID=2527873 RepID=A0A4Q9DR86_9BACL|nr:hypothetical protein [Paenibacillus thalictri]TBL77424.1 hypothetical protein EYB31_18310 [Paenibacillus thalictri]
MQQNEIPTVSLYEICNEYFSSKNDKENAKQKKDQTETAFDPKHHFYIEQKKRFKEMLSCLGVNVDVLKPENQAFAIPAEHKDQVIKLLKSYTSPAMKKIRKKAYSEVDYKEVEAFIKIVDLILDERLFGKDRYDQLARMQVLTRYKVNEAVQQVRNEAVNEIIGSIQELIPIVTESMLNDPDKIGLLSYYKQILITANHHFRKVTEIVSDLRYSSLSELDACSELDSKLLEPVEQLIWEANQIINGMPIATELNKPSSEELKQTERLLNDLKSKSKIK